MANFCRLCLNDSDSFVDVTEEREGLTLSVIVMIICPIKIEKSDALPKQICLDCHNICLQAYKLRDTSNNSDRYLRSSNIEIQEIEFVEDEAKGTIEKLIDDEDFFIKTDQFEGIEQHDDKEEVYEEHEGDEYVVYESDEAENLISTNIKWRVDCQNVHTKKSAVWNYFGYLSDSEGNLVEGERDFYFCKLCVEQKQILKPKYKAESIATSVLFAHLLKVHNLHKSEMVESSAINIPHPMPELLACDICTKSFNSGSLTIHNGLEHQNGEISRSHNNSTQYRVNCFKSSSKSLAWDYFGALEDLEGASLDEFYFYCRLCVEEEGTIKQASKYTKNTSTSILLQHLKNAHIPKTPEEMAKRKQLEPINFAGNSKRMKTEEFSCKLCGEHLESRKSLNQHLLKEHQQDQPRNFSCKIETCQKSFTMRDSLIKHNKNIHENIQKYPCDRCPTMLSTRMSLRRHIESCHLKLKSFACDSCSAVYTEHKSLKSHIQKVHLGIAEKRIPCDLCDLQFPNQWSLRRHQLSHTGEVRENLHRLKLLILIFSCIYRNRINVIYVPLHTQAKVI